MQCTIFTNCAASGSAGMQLVVLGFLSACSASSVAALTLRAIVRCIPTRLLERTQHHGRFAGLAPLAKPHDGGPGSGFAPSLFALGAAA